jgi:hypothetical protein
MLTIVCIGRAPGRVHKKFINIFWKSIDNLIYLWYNIYTKKKGEKKMIEKEFDLTTLTDEELADFHASWEKEARRRSNLRRRNAALLLYEAMGQFIDTMAHYDFEKWISMEFVNEEDENFEFDVNVFDEEILTNIRETLRLKVGQYCGDE